VKIDAVMEKNMNKAFETFQVTVTQ